jgi:aspartate aminotransferase
MQPFARRLAHVTPSATMAVAAEAERLRRAGEDVIDLSAGEPDFPTPVHVKAAAKAAVDADFTRYTSSRGISELREAIGRRYKAAYGIDVSPDEVLVTAGGKQALFNAALALLNPGDQVVVHTPCWPTIPEQVKLADAEPVPVSTKVDDGFAVDGPAIIAAITPRTKAIVLNSPCNPTGALIDEATATSLAQVAADRGLWILADLCYERLIYDDVPHNIPGVLFAHNRARTVLAGSVSKTYAMTGWRCGWTVAPVSLTSAMNTIQGHATSHVASITQKAALAAVDGAQGVVEAMCAEYCVRRDEMHAWLTAHSGIQCVKPAGAFYLFPDISGLFSGRGVASSAAFARVLLERERVVVTPGEVFGAPGYIRISYATSMDKLREGSARILRFADTLRS